MNLNNAKETADLDAEIKQCVQVYNELYHELDLFLDGVTNWFARHPNLSKGDLPIVHSVKRRLKDPDHLAEKIRRKYVTNGHLEFSPSDLGVRVTDLAGLRVLHLYQDQFPTIHERLRMKIDSGDWLLAEDPRAYTWDPESKAFFEKVGLDCSLKESFYTSVHYVVRPKEGSALACEIQIRTLFEEIWGEVDHSLKYPSRTPSQPCLEQLKVLAKLVGAGSRLVDSIYRTS